MAFSSDDLASRDPLLVARAKRGDMSAFEQLYRDNVRRIYGLCRRLLGTEQEAEEMTQRVFVRSWERLPGFRSESRFSTWIHRIALNMVVSERRSRWARAAESLDAVDGEERELAAPGLRTEARRHTVRLDLESAIRRLPTGARQILVLHDVEGHSHPEIAGMLGVTVGTSKSQLARARALLRRSLT